MKWINVTTIGKDVDNKAYVDAMFKAMYIIRQFRMGIVSTKQIEQLKQHIETHAPKGLTDEQVTKIIKLEESK